MGGICVVLLLSLLGCASPGERADAQARRLGLEPVRVQGNGFAHRAYVRGDPGASQRVRVYLEGDGLPWETCHRVSADPTPRYPLMLYLAAQDPVPGLLLGRPCYHGVFGPSCRPWVWTSGRYSESVVRSMVHALRSLLPARQDLRIELVGYSGGGVLAMLMAERMPRVERVVTLAANLDIDAWTDRHGYSRLIGSLNPAHRPPLPARVERLHLVGELDEKVPPALIRAATMRDPAARLRVMPGFDHRCCWEKLWPTILAQLDGAFQSRDSWMARGSL